MYRVIFANLPTWPDDVQCNPAIHHSHNTAVADAIQFITKARLKRNVYRHAIPSSHRSTYYLKFKAFSVIKFKHHLTLHPTSCKKK